MDFSYFKGKSHFEEDGTRNYLVFQPMHRYFKLIPNKKYISEWKSKGLFDESIKPPTASDHSLSSLIDYLGHKIRLEFNESCLKQHKLTYTHQTIVNIYIVYKIIASSSNGNDPTLRNSLFSAVRLTNYDDIDKCRYSGYGIGFDRRSISFPGGGFGSNVIIFGVDMSSSVHVDNKKLILIFGIVSTQGVEYTLTAEKIYSIYYTVTEKKNCLSLHYNGANSYLFVNGTETHKFKAKEKL